MIMPGRKHIVLMLAMAGVLTLPSAVGAQAVDGHADHPPQEMALTAVEQTPSATASVQERRQAMRQRMQEIRTTQDPDRRRQLLEAQMKDIEAMLDEGACPLAAGGMMANRGAPGAMGQGMQCMRGMQHRGMGGGMQHGMGGKGMQGGMACGLGDGRQHGRCEQRQGGVEDAMAGRLEALERRVDLMQMLLQRLAR